MLGAEFILIDAVHHRRVEVVAAGMGEEHFLRPSLQVRLTVFTAPVNAGAVEHHVYRQLAPGQRRNGRLVQQTDGIIANKQLLALLTNIPGETAMAGVIFQQMRDARSIRQLIDSHHGDFRTAPGFI